MGGSISSDENEVRHSTAAQISASDRNKATEPDLRTQFHDSWLFEDVFSELVETDLIDYRSLMEQDPFRSTIAVALRAKMPQSLSAWAITPTFWSPLEGICSGAPLTISSDKKVFLDVDMPDWVLVNEQIQLKVFIHSYHDTGPKEVSNHLQLVVIDPSKLAVSLQFDLCQEFPPQVCVSYGSSDQTSKPVKSVVVGSNGFATVSFFMEFLETGSFNVRFFLLDQKAVVTESNSCADRGAVVDAIEKKIRVEVSIYSL